MTKRWHAVQVCVPSNVHVIRDTTLSAQVLAHICNKLDVKAGGVAVVRQYLQGEGFYTECLLYATEMPSQAKLERWGLEVLKAAQKKR